MSAKKTNTRFQEFIDKQGGVSKVAMALGLSRFTVYFWYNRAKTPNSKNLLLLKEFSKGKLSFDDIMEGTAKES